MTDRRPVGVDAEVGRKVTGGRVVERQIARLDICITWVAITGSLTLERAN